MAHQRSLPETASVATPEENGRLFAPSAARNAEAITAVVVDIAPKQDGIALELASGTGQHVVALAAALPHLHWQPSDVDPERRDSINAYAQQAGLANIAAAANLDATTAGWSDEHSGQSFILLVNLLHLVSTPEARTLIGEAATALDANGTLMIYGPFMRDQELISEGDASFHASLQAQDPELGYKSDFDIVEWGQNAGLDFVDMIEMPANNLAIVMRKPG